MPMTNSDDCWRTWQRLGLAENTIVVITSDHGESLGDHGLTYHGAALYWELVHVPLIIFYPKHIPAAQNRRRLSVMLPFLPPSWSLLGDGAQKMFPGPALSDLVAIS